MLEQKLSDMSVATAAPDYCCDKVQNTNMEIKSRYRALQRKCQDKEGEIQRLTRRIDHMAMEVHVTLAYLPLTSAYMPYTPNIWQFE